MTSAPLRQVHRVTGQVVERLSARTGLDFTKRHGSRMTEIVEAAVAEAADGRATDPAAIVDDPSVYAALVERLTVGETYFFRDETQLDLVRTIATSSDRRSRPLRVWSAGCATGEEPYTLAIVLDEEGALGRAQIMGTDLCETSLRRARDATYGPWSLRRCDERQRAAYFERHRDRFRLRRRYREAVELRAGNLLDGPPVAGGFDLVLCRNVLIYLTDEARTRSALGLRDALAPGGWLILGSADRLPGVEGLDLVRTEHGTAYRRDSSSRAVAAVGEARAAPRARSARRRCASEPLTDRMDGPAPGTRGPSQRSTRPPPDGATPVFGAQEVAGRIRSAVSAGDITRAWELLGPALGAHPLDSGLHVLATTLHLAEGEPTEAVVAARRAVYLAPGVAVTHVLLGRALLLAGDRSRGRRSLLNALDLLAAMPADAEVPLTDGERAGPLAAAVAAMAGG